MRSIQTFFLDRLDESFCAGIRIRRTFGDQRDTNTRFPKPTAHVAPPCPISIQWCASSAWCEIDANVFPEIDRPQAADKTCLRLEGSPTIAKDCATCEEVANSPRGSALRAD
jgi:hypothetical protein